MFILRTIGNLIKHQTLCFFVFLMLVPLPASAEIFGPSDSKECIQAYALKAKSSAASIIFNSACKDAFPTSSYQDYLNEFSNGFVANNPITGQVIVWISHFNAWLDAKSAYEESKSAKITKGKCILKIKELLTVENDVAAKIALREANCNDIKPDYSALKPLTNSQENISNKNPKMNALGACFEIAAQTYSVPIAVLLGIYKEEGGVIGKEKNDNNGNTFLGPMMINSNVIPILAKQWNVTQSTAKTWVRDDPCSNVGVAAWEMRNYLMRLEI